MLANTVNKISLEELFKLPDNHIIKEYRENLGEHEQFITDEIITRSDDFNLYAAMSSGKTFTIIKIALGIRGQDEESSELIPMIIAVPLRSLALQKLDAFIDKYSIPSDKLRVIQGYQENLQHPEYYCFDSEQIESAYEQGVRVFIVVYDSITKFIDTTLDLEEFILVIDEFHLLCNMYDERAIAIKNVIKTRKKFKKTIYLSGTPQGVFVTAHLKTLVFNKEQLDSPCNVKRGIIINRWKNGMDFRLLIINLLMRDPNKKHILFLDNKVQLEFIKYLLKQFGIADREILMLNADENDNVFEVTVAQEIPEHVKYILTTRVISDGVNIFNLNIGTIVLYGAHNMLLARQMIGRFRNGCDVVVDIRKFDPQYNSQVIPDYLSRFKSFLDTATSLEESSFYEENYRILKEIDQNLNRYSHLLSKYYELYIANEVTIKSYYELEDDEFIPNPISDRVYKEKVQEITSDFHQMLDFTHRIVHYKLLKSFAKENFFYEAVNIIDPEIFSLGNNGDKFFGELEIIFPPRIKDMVKYLVESINIGLPLDSVGLVVKKCIKDGTNYKRELSIIKYHLIYSLLSNNKVLGDLFVLEKWRYASEELKKLFADYLAINHIMTIAKPYIENTEDFKIYDVASPELSDNNIVQINSTQRKQMLLAIFEFNSRKYTLENETIHKSNVKGWISWEKLVDLLSLSENIFWSDEQRSKIPALKRMKFHIKKLVMEEIVLNKRVDAVNEINLTEQLKLNLMFLK